MAGVQGPETTYGAFVKVSVQCGCMTIILKFCGGKHVRLVWRQIKFYVKLLTSQHL